MNENRPKSPGPRLGTPQIKSGPRRAVDDPVGGAQQARGAGDSALPTRRSLRQHRRVDSEAGAPAGDVSKATILELPASMISPSDVGPLTGQLPRAIYSERGDTGADYAIKSSESPGSRGSAESVAAAGRPTGVTVGDDGVPVGADGHPLTRRELREWRRRAEAAEVSPQPPSQSRRAQAPAGPPAGTLTGSPATTVEPPTRASLAAEGAALAARIEASGGGDPEAVDPQLLREQELLAERARQLNTGLISQVPAASAGSAAPASPAAASAASPAVSAPGSPATSRATVAPRATVASRAAMPSASQEPVKAQSAHGLDSLEASAWSSRERNLMLVAGVVIVALLIALVLALVL